MSLPKRKGKLEYFPWFAAKYAADTTHLSEPADAAYRRIMDHIFMHDQVTCRVALDDDLLIGISRRSVEEWLKVRRALIDGPAPMFVKEDDELGSWIFSPFLRSVIKEAKKKTRQTKAAAAKRWDDERNAGGMRTHSAGNQREKVKEKRRKKKPTKTSSSPGLERETTATNARTREVSPGTEAWLRMKIREMRGDPPLWELAANDPGAFEQEVRDKTGWSPAELVEITGDDALRIAIEVHA